MAYVHRVVKAGPCVEHKKMQSFRVHTKGVKRGPNTGHTTEKQERINERVAEEHLRWDINANFGHRDLHAVLHYYVKDSSFEEILENKANEKLEAALESGEILTGKVVQVVSGGLNVMYDETRVFIPASLVSDTYEKNLDKYLDQDIEFVLTEYQPKKRRIIGNRKQIVAARKAEAAKALFDRIEVGMIVEGVVKNVTSFGAFIDLGGADGLLHISEMSWGRVDDPKSVLKVGDTVKAFIKNIDGEKIALSLKFDDTNPWLNAAEKYAPGTVVTGKVARMADFGAFIELEPGVDALLHVSQISYEHVNKPEDVYKVGDEVEAVVVECNADDKKISLSVKELLPAPEYTDDVAEDTEE